MYVASNGIKTAVIVQDTSPDNPREKDYQENLGIMLCWHKRYNLGDKHQWDEPIDFAQSLAEDHTNWSELLQFIKDGHAKDLRLVPEGSGYQLQFKALSFNNNRWSDMDGFKFPTDFSDSAAIDRLVWGECNGTLSDVLKEMYTPELIDLCKDKVAILPLYLYDHSGLTMSTSDFGDCWDSGCVGFIYMDKDTAMKELGMAGDEIRIAQAIEGRMAQPIKLSRKSERERAADALIAQGYQRVASSEDITNLNGPAVTKYEGLREKLESATLYKKDNTIYAFTGYNDDLTFNLEPIATYNPNILSVTEETWRDRAMECLRGEVAQYDAYLRGDVYGIQFYEGTNEIESIWGFYETSDQDIRKDTFAYELGDWCDDLIDKMANAAYEPEPTGAFSIEDYFEQNDFPELREQIRQAVCDYITADAAPAQIYPFAMSADDILANKDDVLNSTVSDLYDEHIVPDAVMIHDTIESYAGPSRELQPKLSTADLEPGKEYTESELLAILKKKPSLSDQIAGASARQANQADNKSQPGHEQVR